ncbi:MAG: SDR family NAD(P)-dependent oxidoreductase, partial [Clostridia bacterium]|nr:SDR family NAD(P)-dependent oxidoreductase [Clostridia bacterium]
MKRAIVVGGSNGIGLAIAKKLIADGYFVHIFDRTEPQEGAADTDRYEYIYCDLL